MRVDDIKMPEYALMPSFYLAQCARSTGIAAPFVVISRSPLPPFPFMTYMPIVPDRILRLPATSLPSRNNDRNAINIAVILRSLETRHICVKMQKNYHERAEPR